MSNNRKSSRRALLVAGAAALLTIGIARPRVPLLLYNRTSSMPTGFYLRVSRRSVHRGDIVAFVLPKSAHSYAQLRGERTDLLLLKHVLAVERDFVSTSDGKLCINGVHVGPIARVDSVGRALPHWKSAGVLTEGELLVGSSQPRSFDSRYFGPIHAQQVLGVYRPLTFGTASAALSNGASLHDPPANPLSSAQSASGGKSKSKESKATREVNQYRGQGKGRLLTLRVTAASIWSWV